MSIDPNWTITIIEIWLSCCATIISTPIFSSEHKNIAKHIPRFEFFLRRVSWILSPLRRSLYRFFELFSLSLTRPNLLLLSNFASFRFRKTDRPSDGGRKKALCYGSSGSYLNNHAGFLSQPDVFPALLSSQATAAAFCSLLLPNSNRGKSATLNS